MFHAFTETTYFWRLASNLQTALRVYGQGQHVDECYEDLEGLAFATDSDVILTQCEALLSKRTPQHLDAPELLAPGVPRVANYTEYPDVVMVVEGRTEAAFLKAVAPPANFKLVACCGNHDRYDNSDYDHHEGRWVTVRLWDWP